MILLALVLSAHAGLWEELKEWRADGAEVERGLLERAQLRALVADIVRSAPGGVVPSDASTRAAVLGLTLERRSDLVLLRSTDGGEAFVLVRLGAPELPPLVLQAPHAWYDADTGALACALFEEGHGRVLMLNAGQRYGGPMRDPRDEGFDLAHRSDTFFQSATLATAEALPGALIVQLHGFGAQHGEQLAVVSGGSSLLTAAELERARVGLEIAFAGLGAVLLSDEYPELGGRGNVQGQGLAGIGRFLHVELSRDAREILREQSGLREAAGAVFVQLAEAR